MKFLLLLLTLSLVACTAEEEVVSAGSSNPDAPTRWPLSAFPKTVKYSNAFSGAELTAIQNSANSWTTHAGAGTTFISSSTAAGALVAEKSSVGNLDSLMDGTLGVYKATQWHADLPATALAVTQIFGVRKNRGKSNEFVEIVEGDILVNYENFPFTPTDPMGYDLFTVVLHEFGHFLGLNHTYNFGSVMYPSIGFATVYNQPGAYDVSVLQSQYNIGGAGPMASGRGLASALSVEEEPTSLEDAKNSQDGVRILMELYPNGECVHKVNGHTVESHRIQNLK